MEWGVFGTIFGTVRFFRKKNETILGALLPARIIITAADTVLTECYVKRLCDSFIKVIRMYKNGQKRDKNCTFTYKEYMKLLIKESTLTS